MSSMLGSFEIKMLPMDDSGGYEIPSCIAISKNSEGMVFGGESTLVDEDSYDLLIDWKILIGKSSAEINAESTRNPVLRKVLNTSGKSLQPVLDGYIKQISSRLSMYPFQEPPDFVVGIPVTSDYESSQWRRRYKDNISKAFKAAGMGRPHFFPEPFAVFQHHWNKGNILDTGNAQNILIVDVGGGTTNSCLIQTTSHGILARGGGNKIPHGVKSVMIGGSRLDALILQRAEIFDEEHSHDFLIMGIRRAKEKISDRCISMDWSNDALLKEIFESVLVCGKEIGVVSALAIKEAFEHDFWPAVKETVESTINDLREKNLPNRVDRIDTVVLAGGTCQLGVIEYLFYRDMSKKFGELSVSKVIRDPAYNSAVASGLAIEAFANCKFHGVKPTRVSAFLNEDVQLKVSHDQERIEVPARLSIREGLVGVDRERGVIISAPSNIGDILNREMQWSFKFKQKPQDVSYTFTKLPVGKSDGGELISTPGARVKVAKRGVRRSQAARLRGVIDDYGFLRSYLGFVDDSDEFSLEPVDLHDLSGLEGNCFLGLDIGTNSTICSFVNAKEAQINQFIPDRYHVGKSIVSRCEKLESEAVSLMKSDVSLKKVNERLVADYVYHSNRIEGSRLGRGETQELLGEIGESIGSHIPDFGKHIEQVSYVDDVTGKILIAKRPVKDGAAALNLRDAFRFVEDIALSGDERFSSHELRLIHQLVMRGDYVNSPGDYRSDNVGISDTTYVPPEHYKVKEHVESMFARLASDEFIGLPAIVQAAEAHVWFVSIHPFSDGNGRVARLLANYFLWRRGLPGINISWENRDRYYDALEYCNSKDVSRRGDLSDVVSLFCDSFEDALEDIRLSFSHQASDSYLAMVPSQGVSSFDGLLKKISGKALAASIVERYGIWENDFLRVSSLIDNFVTRLNETLAVEFKGRARLSKFPIIDHETFSAICRREKFSRTWFFKILISVGDRFEELVFYFAPASRALSDVAPDFSSTCSLHISRYDPVASRHIRVVDESWSRVVEVCHDGSSLSVVQKSDGGILSVDSVTVDEWFSLFIEDLMKNLFGMDL